MSKTAVRMEIAEHIAQLRSDGALLAATAAAAGLDTPVSTCPEWVMRDLVQHLGGVHRWAMSHVRDGRHEMWEAPLVDIVGGAWPDDAQLIDWFRDGYNEFADVLSSADPAIDCWTFLPAPSPLAFWARRQAHETAIHRVDAESNGAMTPFPITFAADGIDELLTCFVVRPRTKLRSDTQRTLAVVPTDDEARWLVRISNEPVVTERTAGTADCTVRGTANDLYLWLWNRIGTDRLSVEGTGDVPEMWRELVRVRWS